MKVSSVAKMRELDWTAIEKFGIEDKLLMENAGLATYGVIRDEIGIKDRRFVVFCGVGNNGGDGFVVARKIYSNGGQVVVYIVGNRKKFTGSAAMNLASAERLPLQVEELRDAASAEAAVSDCDAIIDAIFGTGLARDVTGLHREVIDLINAASRPVFSVDIPSGVNGDTGR
ncbi:MAG: NAD(P)H-hydrate epimerase [Deltaproteobacteria bacterium]|nr:NAD(P)H-hydrate epimerase [Deltaproteobacteria bacterium]